MGTFRVNHVPDRGSFADRGSAALKYDVLRQVGAHEIPDCIDLTECVHLKPYSIACLCGLAALARTKGQEIELKPPKDTAFAEHLCRLEVPRWFKCGPLPEVVRRESNLPVEQVRWGDVGAAERIIEMLAPNAGLPPGVGPTMKASLDEIIKNALTHAESPIDCIVVGQAFPGTGKVEIAVLDLGQTIRGHLTKNPLYAHIKTDADAIQLATEDGVTGTPSGRLNRRGEANSGAGLHYVRSYCEHGAGELTILSGDAWVTYSDGIPVIGRLHGSGFLGCLVNVRFYTFQGLHEAGTEPIL